MSSPIAPENDEASAPPSSSPPSSKPRVFRGFRSALSVLAERWEIQRVLGEGGTARVYGAIDRQDGRPVAIKVLREELARDRTMRERFRREAYAANRVQHPAVVRVLGDGALDDGTPFLVMELLEGETLEQRAERKGGKLPATEVLWAIDRVLDVLAVAHGAGIVHRDLKPDNIFVTHDRSIKVVDFGLARLKETPADEQLTTFGLVMGTPSFMPPEQAKGQWDQVDVQTDLWALGATMFYLLSGRLVHEGEKVHEVVEAATKQTAPSLALVAPHLPSSIVELVDYALVFDMQQRWRTARLMQRALRSALHQLRHGDRELLSADDDEGSVPSEPSFGPDEDPEPPPLSMTSEHLSERLKFTAQELENARPRLGSTHETLLQTELPLPRLELDSETSPESEPVAPGPSPATLVDTLPTRRREPDRGVLLWWVIAAALTVGLLLTLWR